jgi:hypothetical protein
MEFYRCFFLNAADSVFSRAAFHAIDDHEARERATAQTQMHPAAHGYSLWQGGHLVVERAARADSEVGSMASAPGGPDGR